jgi:hypothetical protein
MRFQRPLLGELDNLIFQADSMIICNLHWKFCVYFSHTLVHPTSCSENWACVFFHLMVQTP